MGGSCPDLVSAYPFEEQGDSRPDWDLWICSPWFAFMVVKGSRASNRPSKDRWVCSLWLILMLVKDSGVSSRPSKD